MWAGNPLSYFIEYSHAFIAGLTTPFSTLCPHWSNPLGIFLSKGSSLNLFPLDRQHVKCLEDERQGYPSDSETLRVWAIEMTIPRTRESATTGERPLLRTVKAVDEDMRGMRRT